MPDIKKIDVAKAVTFLLIFTAISVISLVTMLVPIIRDYKKQSEIYKVEYSLYLKAKERHDEESKRLQTLKDANIKLITALSKTADQKNIQNLASRHFNSLKIDLIQKKGEEGGFYYDEFNVTGSLTTPKELFLFLQKTSEDGSVLRVKTPLVLGGDERGLISNFTVRAYYDMGSAPTKSESKAPVHKPAAEHPHH